MKELSLSFNQDGKILSVKYGSALYFPDYFNKEGYFKHGDYCLFISKRKIKIGLKFFIIENENYPLEIISVIYSIYSLLNKNGWCVRPISIFQYTYNGQISWGIKIEKAEYSKSGKVNFDKTEFREFCINIKGLKKSEPKYDKNYGVDWAIKNPEFQFYVGNRNLMKTIYDKTVLIDIDPRWSFYQE